MKMFKFIKKIFVSTLMFFSGLSNVNPLECVSMKNQECKIRPEIVDVNSNDPICMCTFDGIICNNKQCWNENKCRCECKEIIDKSACDKGFFWNPSNCKCECDKSCDIGEYLDYKNCKCRKKLIDPVIEECTENIDKTKIINETKITNENDNKHKYIVYIVLFSIIITINIVTGIFFVYHKYVNRNKYDLPY